MLISSKLVASAEFIMMFHFINLSSRESRVHLKRIFSRLRMNLPSRIIGRSRRVTIMQSRVRSLTFEFDIYYVS